MLQILFDQVVDVPPRNTLELSRARRYKFFSLGSEFNKTLTAEAKAVQANCVLLSAISIPEIR